MKVDSCPGCGAASFDEIGRAAGGFSVEAGGEAFLQPSYRLRQCKICRLYFKSDIWSEVDEARYYRAVDYSKWDSEGLFPPERIMLRLLRRLSRGSAVLDYGCATGRLLGNVTEEMSCFGLEINERSAAVAAKRGIRMLSSAQLVSAHPGGFNAIVLSDVFEHMRSPLELLTKLSACLRSGGLLIVSTGDGDAALPREYIADFWYMRNIEHLSMLNRDHCGFVARRLGLQLRQQTQVSHYDYSMASTLPQWIRYAAYRQFAARPSSLLTKLMHFVPRVKRAANWPVAPFRTYRKDHLVAVFEKP